MRKLTLALDIDGVLRDVVTTACWLYNKTYGADLTPDDITEYNFRNSMTELSDPVRWIFETHSSTVLSGSLPFVGAARAVEMLSKYCDIHIVSKQPTNDAKIRTMSWLCENIPTECLASVQLTQGNKRTVLNGYDIVIDDWQENFRGIDCRMGVLVQAAYNDSFHPQDEPSEFPLNFAKFDDLITFAEVFTSFLASASDTLVEKMFGNGESVE